MMKKPKILLIEDEKVIIEFYKELFTNLASYDLEVIEQCESALRALKEIRGGKREKWDSEEKKIFESKELVEVLFC